MIFVILTLCCQKGGAGLYVVGAEGSPRDPSLREPESTCKAPALLLCGSSAAQRWGQGPK